MKLSPFLAGKLLLAMPDMGDPRFDHAVIAMCSHDPEGALGIGIGKLLPDVGLHSLLDQLGIEKEGVFDAPIHHGGPVEPQRGFVLHSNDWGGQGTIHVNGQWGLTGTLDVLRVIGRPNGPTRWLVALGYAGWGAGQLEGELMRPGWHIADADDRLLFDLPPTERWQQSFLASGVNPRMLAMGAGHA